MKSESSAPLSPALPNQRRPRLLLAGAAGLCWVGAIALLVGPDLVATAELFSPLRVIFYALVLAAALLTFVPLEVALRIPGLALEGACGALLLLYALAFIPPPTAPIYHLPDTPVYLIFLGGLFALISAAALPLVALVGQRVFRRRARQYDLVRSRRQAHAIGALAVAYGVLGGLRIQTPLSVLLATLVVVLIEILFLAYVEAAQ
ncbi:MAG: hypothetical protein H7Z42_20730 [Roseiflexaceae bacterium]|nr:hypothetical protein [Roseiflexaceae bacterium]